jgi:flagellar hook-basal body complex protein FliE
VGCREQIGFAKKRNFEEPNELDEVIQSNNNQTNTEFNGQLSEEASEIINSYRTATELQKAIDDGTITNKEVIDYVSMLKTENA